MIDNKNMILAVALSIAILIGFEMYFSKTRPVPADDTEGPNRGTLLIAGGGGKQAAAMKFINFSVPKSKLRAETMKIARKLMQKNPSAIQYTKQAMRSVRHMSMDQAADFLAAKSAALQFVDKEGGRQEGMRQFLDTKTFRPGLKTYKRKRG